MPIPTLDRRWFLQASLATLAASSCPAPLEAQATLAWLDDIQRPPAKLPADAPRLAPLLVDDQGRAITTLAAWQARRRVIRQRWEKFLGQLSAKRESVPKLEVLAEDKVEGVIRQRVRYEVEPKLPTEAYLLRPEKPSDKPRPGVVVFHSTVNESIHQPAGVKGQVEKAFGLQLAKRGFVTFCPRNYLWPDNDRLAAKEEAERFLKREPQCLGMAKMLYDAQVALDILAAQADVDPARLGAVGHSLGAKETLYLAAFDERVKATISSEGGIGIGFSNWQDAWYLGLRVKEPDFKLEHHELLALIAPRALLLIGGDSADGDRSWPFIAAALPVYKLQGDPTARHVGLWNHKQGHSVPEEAVKRVEEWCLAML